MQCASANSRWLADVHGRFQSLCDISQQSPPCYLAIVCKTNFSIHKKLNNEIYALCLIDMEIQVTISVQLVMEHAVEYSSDEFRCFCCSRIFYYTNIASIIKLIDSMPRPASFAPMCCS